MTDFLYQGEHTNEISFPIGGIGTGSIGIGGNGRLIDWEIFNRPSKGSTNGFSHFAVKVERNGEIIDARVLNGDMAPPYSGDYNGVHFDQFGFGVSRSSMAGFPHFKSVDFLGVFPFANLFFFDDTFPGRIKMTAFNPFIPLNTHDSGIPAAFFEFAITNTLEQAADYTLVFALSSPTSGYTCLHTYSNDNGIHMLRIKRNDVPEHVPDYTDMAIATDAEEVSYQEYWYRGMWFDNTSLYWRDLNTPGSFANRTYGWAPNYSKNPRIRDTGHLAACMHILPEETKTVRFVLSWNSPVCHNYWSPVRRESADRHPEPDRMDTWRNHYATMFKNAGESALYSLTHWNRLYKETLMFKDALFSSTIPKKALDAISANLSTLKSPTCLRLEDGSFYGFEGCHCDSGCCEGSCTHVWNYAYALPFLFPVLERSMRSLDYTYNMADDGGMIFRLQLPLGREKRGLHSCADGQFGGVIKTYRDWKISGDDAWLMSLWPKVKKSLAFAWHPSNLYKWDINKDGVLEGRQHHTLDMELFGPNPWLTGFYLAALKAGSEMAEYLGEPDVAAEYKTLFEKGRKWVDDNLFNGRYFCQRIDLKDKKLLMHYDKLIDFPDDNILKTYWNEETNEIKYQIGEGCSVDQVVAQWHANLCGLGEIFDRDKVKNALQSIYRYNFKRSMRNIVNPCRIFSLNDESGVVICDWPAGTYKPIVPAPYSEETMNGFEYQVAVHMIQEGMVEEGMEIVKAVRERYDGRKRNPWNEFECGSHYARSMASYALLNAFSGFDFDMTKGYMGFSPVIKDGLFKIFWSLDAGWGTYETDGTYHALHVLYGSVNLQRFGLGRKDKVRHITKDNESVLFEQTEHKILFKSPVVIQAGQRLVFHCDIKNSTYNCYG